MKRGVPAVFFVLTAAYLIFSGFLYAGAGFNEKSPASPDDFVQGKKLWQKYNCQSCHQIYGLGGYLGPDLTNVYSRAGGNRDVLAGMIRSGNRWMQAYRLSDEEMKYLTEFFRALDASGNADPRSMKKTGMGMTQPYEK